jgi:hypothetical protein
MAVRSRLLFSRGVSLATTPQEYIVPAGRTAVIRSHSVVVQSANAALPCNFNVLVTDGGVTRYIDPPQSVIENVRVASVLQYFIVNPGERIRWSVTSPAPTFIVVTIFGSLLLGEPT